MKVAYIGTCESDPAMEASEPMSENGWNCSKGWDPATGLGTPLFKKLMAAAMGG